MHSRRPFDVSEVLQLLEALVERLSNADDATDLYVVGGTAMSILNAYRQTTTDIDCWLGQSPISSSVIADLDTRWGPAATFIDEGVKQFIPTLLMPQEAFDIHHVRRSVTVHVAKPEVLLAMKLKASRIKDQPDISFLVKHLNITLLDEAEAILEWCFPGDALTDKAIMRLGLAFDEQP